MKKLLFSLTAGMLCLLMSCNDKGGSGDGKTSEAAQKNMEAHKGISKAIESGDVSKLGDYIAADAVDHSAMGDIKGLDSIKAMLGHFSKMATDMKIELVKMVADDEYVFAWERYTGTSASAEMGMPPGTKFDMNAVQVSKYKDGKAVEHWEFSMTSEMMKMMQQMQGQGMKPQEPMPADTSKM